MRRTRGAVTIIIILVTILTPHLILSAKEEFEFQTTYRIILHGDSSATWIVELSTTLSQDTLSDFREFIESADREELLSSFMSTINSIVRSASKVTQRQMKAEDFKLEMNVTGIIRQRGVIKYSFKWINFSLKTPDTVRVGDVFEGGFYLFSNEMLEIIYSELVDDYFLKSVSPQSSMQEDSKVVWNGKMDFPDGEPSLIFQNRTIIIQSFLNASMVEKGSAIKIYGYASPKIPELIIQLVYVKPDSSKTVRDVYVNNDGFFSDILFTDTVGNWSVYLRLPLDSPYRLTQASQPISFSVYYREVETPSPSLSPSILDIPQGAVVISALLILIFITSFLLYRSRKKLSPPPPPELLMSDKELVIKILKESGGMMSQTQIKEATGFSKSKTSMVLSEMQRKGLIRKIKRGREYIVQLV